MMMGFCGKVQCMVSASSGAPRVPADVLVLADDVEGVGEGIVLDHLAAVGVRAENG